MPGLHSNERGAEDGQIFIGRQPILDRRERVVAYELLYRDSADSMSAVFSDVRVAATRVMANTFASMGADAILGPYRGFLNIDRRTLVSELVDVLPKDRVVIEILESIEADSEVVETCKRLCEDDFAIALDDYVCRDARAPLLEFAKCVKVDLMAVSDRDLPGVVRELKRYPVELVAEKVETREQFERCRKLGFDLFQGFYFARAKVISGTRVDPTRRTLLQLLRKIREDVDTDVLCDTIKQHASIGVNVLRLVNSAGRVRAQKISTVRDAVTQLGRRHLSRWFNVLLYAGDDRSGLSSPLLLTAAKRARLMELLARDTAEKELEDSAFLTGMASLLDALLGIPRAEVVRELNLDDEIGSALLDHGGTLGSLLTIAESLESGDFPAVAELVAEFGITAEQTVQAELEAFRWVQQLSEAFEGDESDSA